ncbi:MAG TPA: hypothetical protein P5539_13800 [Mesotoga sp.]|nr:hypothetical protein [Mesotoga sp.]
MSIFERFCTLLPSLIKRGVEVTVLTFSDQSSIIVDMPAVKKVYSYHFSKDFKLEDVTVCNTETHDCYCIAPRSLAPRIYFTSKREAASTTHGKSRELVALVD